MENLKNVVLYEVDKIKGQKKYKRLIFIEVGILLLFLIMYFLFNTFLKGSQGEITTQTIMYFMARVDITSATLSAFSGTILPFFIFMLATDLFASEFSDNTIKNILLRPANRFTIYLGKILAILTYIAFNLAIIFVITFIGKIFLGSKLNKELEHLLGFIIVLIPLAVVTAFSALVSSFSKTPSSSMFLLIFTFIGFSVLSLAFSQFSALNFLNYLDFYKIILGGNLPFMNILNTTMLILSTGAIFFILGFLIFENKNV